MNLNKQWEEATVPEAFSVHGKYKVKVLSGVFRPWSWQYHNWKKEIIRLEGHNIQRSGFKDIYCGYFFLHYRMNALVLSYEHPRNNRTWQRLTDKVRQTGHDTYLGKIYLRLWGKSRFMGYFSLVKISEEVDNSR